MAANKAAIESQLAERKRMLSGLEDEIARIEAAERARAEAAARAAVVSRSTATAIVPTESFPAPTRAARSEVVSIAKRYLGAPYRWAASGPNSFDCSGFTMFVYRQVGVSLPHSSRAQFGSGQKVPRGSLQPGDLVFFGSPIHHVGIYVGGGQYIHSPRTGDVVKISSLSARTNYTGAVRP
ncbi:MAG: C40 family peptidase [Anaerosomatales bacterium]